MHSRIEVILFAAGCLLTGAALGIIGEAIEERVRTWWRDRKYGGKKR
jgi:hypothetical protein